MISEVRLFLWKEGQVCYGGGQLWPQLVLKHGEGQIFVFLVRQLCGREVGQEDMGSCRESVMAEKLDGRRLGSKGKGGGEKLWGQLRGREVSLWRSLSTEGFIHGGTFPPECEKSKIDPGPSVSNNYRRGGKCGPANMNSLSAVAPEPPFSPLPTVCL